MGGAGRVTMRLPERASGGAPGLAQQQTAGGGAYLAHVGRQARLAAVAAKQKGLEALNRGDPGQEVAGQRAKRAADAIGIGGIERQTQDLIGEKAAGEVLPEFSRQASGLAAWRRAQENGHTTT